MCDSERQLDCNNCIDILKKYNLLPNVESFILTNSQKNELIKNFNSFKERPRDENYSLIKECVKTIAKQNKCIDCILNISIIPSIPQNLNTLPVYALEHIFENMSDDEIVLTCYTDKKMMDNCLKSKYNQLLENEKEYRKRFVDKFGIDKRQHNITWRKQWEDFENTNKNRFIYEVLLYDYDDLIEFGLPKDDINKIAKNFQYYGESITVLGKAVQLSAHKSIKKLVELGADTNNGGENFIPLLQAIASEDVKMVETLLKLNALQKYDEEYKKNGRYISISKNLLMYYIDNYPYDNSRDKAIKIAKLLREYGYNFNINDYQQLQNHYQTRDPLYYIEPLYYIDPEFYIQKALNKEFKVSLKILDQLLGSGYSYDDFEVGCPEQIEHTGRGYYKHNCDDDGIIEYAHERELYNIFNHFIDKYDERLLAKKEEIEEEENSEEEEESEYEEEEEENVSEYEEEEENSEYEEEEENSEYEEDEDVSEYEEEEEEEEDDNFDKVRASILEIYSSTYNIDLLNKLFKYIDEKHKLRVNNKEYLKELINKGYKDYDGYVLNIYINDPEIVKLLLSTNKYGVYKIIYKIYEVRNEKEIKDQLFNYFKDIEIKDKDYEDALNELLGLYDIEIIDFVKVLLDKHLYDKAFIEKMIANINKLIYQYQNASDVYLLHDLKQLLKDYVDKSYKKIILEPVELKPVSAKNVVRQWDSICNSPEREAELGKLDKMELMWLAAELGIANMVNKEMSKEQLCKALDIYAESIKQ